LRVENKNNQGKETKVVPFWPGPNDPLEDHATTWRNVLRGLLQYPIVNQTDPAPFHHTLVGASQALYKHTETLIVNMPGLGSNVRRDLLKELEWLKEFSRKTIAARTMEWEKRPKGHVVIDALCSPSAKGQAIRSGLCAISFLAEKKLEEAFESLIQKLASAAPADTDAQAKLLDWRKEASEIIRQNIRRVVDFAITRSPLRRGEARQQVNESVRKASIDATADVPLITKKGAK